MDFVTVSTGLILPYWMGLSIRYIQKGELFFGCIAFYRHKVISTTINLKQGLNLLKDKNKLEVTNIRDLEDEY